MGGLEVAGHWHWDGLLTPFSREKKKSGRRGGVGSHGTKYEFLASNQSTSTSRCFPFGARATTCYCIVQTPALRAREYDSELATVVAMHFKGTQITAARPGACGRNGHVAPLEGARASRVYSHPYRCAVLVPHPPQASEGAAVLTVCLRLEWVWVRTMQWLSDS